MMPANQIEPMLANQKATSWHHYESLSKKSPDNKSRSGKFARDYYQTAKDLDPRHGKPHFNLGILASEQQRHFEAIIHFIRAASVDKAGGSSGLVHLTVRVTVRSN